MMNRVGCCRLSDVSTSNAVAIFRVIMYLGFRMLYIERAGGGAWDVKDQIGGTEERAAMQPVTNTWLRKRGDEKCF
jgi:hypothetical protein